MAHPREGERRLDALPERWHLPLGLGEGHEAHSAAPQELDLGLREAPPQAAPLDAGRARVGVRGRDPGSRPGARGRLTHRVKRPQRFLTSFPLVTAQAGSSA